MYYYKQLRDRKIISVEAKNRDSLSLGFKKATKVEYDGYMASLPPPAPPEPIRDLAAEIDELRSEVQELKLR